MVDQAVIKLHGKQGKGLMPLHKLELGALLVSGKLACELCVSTCSNAMLKPDRLVKTQVVPKVTQVCWSVL